MTIADIEKLDTGLRRYDGFVGSSSFQRKLESSFGASKATAGSQLALG
ncbi:hypothetical protein [Tahibacter soli]|uniref:Uncharacterized protein n=1 Tax=Tahibacter soli TaxID=2983605 RepID=A0A9X3YMQ9_9GAMM|nr:hypothetical protein [Tahibacter soli]MDC8014509.1 hypothetical protein [Tahibacter soli]